MSTVKQGGVGGNTNQTNSNSDAQLEAQRKQSEMLFALQVKQSMQTELAAAKTNMEKSRHDAMMSVISNFKG